ncbi:hypothetical protein Vafri_14249 [Volvox africanus]|uniref:Glycosyltransferase n=2 Tax=Volvox africanus TaxID=51714 RepID=A0A8J4BEH0_9CHLO|nr:hypothetical protein Vafri_14249 [Volvox africanus]
MSVFSTSRLMVVFAVGWLCGSGAVQGQVPRKQEAIPQGPPSGSAKADPIRISAGSPSIRRITADHSLSLPNWCSAGPYARDGEPLFTSMTRKEPSYKLYHNAYWHAHKWYALVPPDAMLRDGCQPGVPSSAACAARGSDADGSRVNSADGGSVDGLRSSPLEEGLSVNCALINLPVSNISAFTDNMRAGFLPGTTLLVDFPFPAFPDNLGHWAEIMFTTYSVLADGAWRNNTVGNRGRYVDRILLPNLRKEMNDWFKEILAVAASPGVRRGGPPVPSIIDHADLEAFPKLSWLIIENLLVVQDRYTHPERKTGFIGADHGDLWRYDGCARYVNRAWEIGFSDPSFAAAFRAAIYKRAGLPYVPGWEPGTPPPAPVSGSPRVMTLLLAHEDYPPLVNWEDVQATMHKVASAAGLVVRTVTLSTDAPFASHLDTYARSSVLVARHGPLLATASLMAPGSTVFELLPYKWEWLGISKLYYNMTRSTGDLHHFAWRPTDHRLAHYDHENYTRYHTWTPEECSARECLMVHGRAGLTVNLTEFETLLRAKLPDVLAGKGVEELREPWPKAL